MIHIVEFLLTNKISLFVICYLLIVPPIIGIMVVHNQKPKYLKETLATGPLDLEIQNTYIIKANKSKQ